MQCMKGGDNEEKHSTRFFYKHTLFFGSASGCLSWSHLWASCVLRRVLKTHCKIAWNLLFINFKRFCHTISVLVYPMSIPLYVFTSHISQASICVSIGPYICLSHVQKPFYCLTSKMRWPTLTQNYKYWEWGKILYFEKNQTLLLLFLMSLIFFKMQNFIPFSIFIILRNIIHLILLVKQ